MSSFKARFLRSESLERTQLCMRLQKQQELLELLVEVPPPGPKLFSTSKQLCGALKPLSLRNLSLQVDSLLNAGR